MSDSDDELESIRQRKIEERSRDTADGAPGEEAAATSDPIHVDSLDHFQALLTDHPVVLVDFYADWCGPCKMLEPTVAELANETDATVAKVDVDAHQQLAGQYGLRGVPTVYLFVDGEPAEQWVGVRDKGTYAGAIQQHA